MPAFLDARNRVRVVLHPPEPLPSFLRPIRSQVDIAASPLSVEAMARWISRHGGTPLRQRLRTRDLTAWAFWRTLTRHPSFGARPLPDKPVVADARRVKDLPPIRPRSRTATVVRLLRRRRGASIVELTAATGWQVHSVRALLSAKIRTRFGKRLVTTGGANRRYRIETYKMQPIRWDLPALAQLSSASKRKDMRRPDGTETHPYQMYIRVRFPRGRR